jgi:AcrR family transcriptional regulator
VNELQPVGLRDRKRQETRSRLEHAAVDIVLRDGLEHLTVDAMSELADVSPRTFFNYFESKEDAILGLHDPEITDETVTQHLSGTAGADLIESLMGLLFSVLGSSIGDTDLHHSRMTILQQHPQLLRRHMAQMNRMLEQLTATTQTLMARDHRFADVDASRTAPMAQVVLMVCGGSIRAAVKEWAEADGKAPIEELEQRAITLVREVTERLR